MVINGSCRLYPRRKPWSSRLRRLRTCGLSTAGALMRQSLARAPSVIACLSFSSRRHAVGEQIQTPLRACVIWASCRPLPWKTQAGLILDSVSLQEERPTHHGVSQILEWFVAGCWSGTRAEAPGVDQSLLPFVVSHVSDMLCVCHADNGSGIANAGIPRRALPCSGCARQRQDVQSSQSVFFAHRR